ncbi:hypothetical protein [Nannocystis pusilla]
MGNVRENMRQRAFTAHVGGTLSGMSVIAHGFAEVRPRRPHKRFGAGYTQ